MKIILVIVIVFALLVGGCTGARARSFTTPRGEMSYGLAKFLALQCMSHFDTGDATTEEVMADLKLAEYLERNKR